MRQMKSKNKSNIKFKILKQKQNIVVYRHFDNKELIVLVLPRLTTCRVDSQQNSRLPKPSQYFLQGPLSQCLIIQHIVDKVMYPAPLPDILSFTSSLSLNRLHVK